MSYLDKLFSLQNKVVIVTGAARGNGKAMANALLKSKATVVLVDKIKELQKTVDTFKRQGLSAYKYTCDVTNEKELDKLVEFVGKKFHKIDVLINNAGVTYEHEPLSYPLELWESTYRVNLKAPFLLSQKVGKYMKKNRTGIIINITSLNAELAFPNNPAYAVFKGGLKQLTKSLALDLGKYNIRVNNIGPGYFRTNMTKKSWKSPSMNKKRRENTILNRWGEPKDLSGIVIFLASEASSYITGQDLYIDGGWLVKGMK